MPICLLCLIGLPGSGKSRLARCLNGEFSTTVIEYDALYPNYEIKWKAKRHHIGDIVRNKINTSDPNRKTLLVLDDNFYYRSMRYEWYRVAKEIEASFCQIYLDIPVVQCLINNSTRNFPIPTEVILKMNYKIELPNSNYHWESQTLFLKDPSDMLKIYQFIDDAFRCRIKIERPQVSEQHIQSNKHYADLAVRKYINKVMETSKDPQLAKQLASKKVEFFELIKSECVAFPKTNASNPLAFYKEFVEQYFNEILMN